MAVGRWKKTRVVVGAAADGRSGHLESVAVAVAGGGGAGGGGCRGWDIRHGKNVLAAAQLLALTDVDAAADAGGNAVFAGTEKALSMRRLLLWRTGDGGTAGHVQIVAVVVCRGGILDGGHGLPGARSGASLRIGILVIVAGEHRPERDGLAVAEGELEGAGGLGFADGVHRVGRGARG